MFHSKMGHQLKLAGDISKSARSISRHSTGKVGVLTRFIPRTLGDPLRAERHLLGSKGNKVEPIIEGTR